MKEITLQDVLLLLGHKEVELAILRQQLAEAQAKVPQDEKPKE